MRIHIKMGNNMLYETE